MKLLLIGPSTRAMAESARRAKYDFFTIDFFGDADQKRICKNYSLKHEFKEELCIENLVKHAKELNKEKIGFTHTVYGSGFENCPELVEELERKCVALGNSAEVLRKVRDWGYFFKTAKSLGISAPENEIVNINEVKKRKKITENKNFVVKPLKTGGGHNICNASELSSASFEKNEKVLLQEFIEGKAASGIIAASKEESTFLGATKQIIGTGFNKYKYAGNIAPLDEKKSVLKKMEEASLKIAEKFKLIGINGIDFIVKNGEVFVIEVNPRITGAIEVVERAYKVNLVDIHVKACLNNLPKLKIIKPEKFYGKKIIFAEQNFNFRLKKVHRFVKDVPHYNERIEARAPVCTVFAGGETSERCRANLEKREALVMKALQKTF